MIKSVILPEKIYKALKEIYTSEREIFLFLVGKFKNEVAIVTDLKYELQESSFDSVYFKFQNSDFIGTFHTHPEFCKPSQQDLITFNKLGGVHIIMTKNKICAYNSYGDRINLIILRDFKPNNFRGSLKLSDLIVIYVSLAILLIVILAILYLIF